MLDTTDLIILVLVLLGTLAYFTKGKLWAKPAQVGYGYGTQHKATANGSTKPKKTRNIVERMEQQNKNVVVFFGSQTGTAGTFPLLELVPEITDQFLRFLERLLMLCRGLFHSSCERGTFSLWSQYHDCRPGRI